MVSLFPVANDAGGSADTVTAAPVVALGAAARLAGGVLEAVLGVGAAEAAGAS
jgi:hypothetical protein